MAGTREQQRRHQWKRRAVLRWLQDEHPELFSRLWDRADCAAVEHFAETGATTEER